MAWTGEHAGMAMRAAAAAQSMAEFTVKQLAEKTGCHEWTASKYAHEMVISELAERIGPCRSLGRMGRSPERFRWKGLK